MPPPPLNHTPSYSQLNSQSPSLTFTPPSPSISGLHSRSPTVPQYEHSNPPSRSHSPSPSSSHSPSSHSPSSSSSHSSNHSSSSSQPQPPAVSSPSRTRFKPRRKGRSVFNYPLELIGNLTGYDSSNGVFHRRRKSGSSSGGMGRRMSRKSKTALTLLGVVAVFLFFSSSSSSSHSKSSGKGRNDGRERFASADGGDHEARAFQLGGFNFHIPDALAWESAGRKDTTGNNGGLGGLLPGFLSAGGRASYTTNEGLPKKRPSKIPRKKECLCLAPLGRSPPSANDLGSLPGAVAKELQHPTVVLRGSSTEREEERLSAKRTWWVGPRAGAKVDGDEDGLDDRFEVSTTGGGDWEEEEEVEEVEVEQAAVAPEDEDADLLPKKETSKVKAKKPKKKLKYKGRTGRGAGAGAGWNAWSGKENGKMELLDHTFVFDLMDKGGSGRNVGGEGEAESEEEPVPWLLDEDANEGGDENQVAQTKPRGKKLAGVEGWDDPSYPEYPPSLLPKLNGKPTTFTSGKMGQGRKADLSQVGSSSSNSSSEVDKELEKTIVVSGAYLPAPYQLPRSVQEIYHRHSRNSTKFLPYSNPSSALDSLPRFAPLPGKNKPSQIGKRKPKDAQISPNLRNHLLKTKSRRPDWLKVGVGREEELTYNHEHGDGVPVGWVAGDWDPIAEAEELGSFDWRQGDAEGVCPPCPTFDVPSAPAPGLNGYSWVRETDDPESPFAPAKPTKLGDPSPGYHSSNHPHLIFGASTTPQRLSSLIHHPSFPSSLSQAYSSDPSKTASKMNGAITFLNQYSAEKWEEGTGGSCWGHWLDFEGEWSWQKEKEKKKGANELLDKEKALGLRGKNENDEGGQGNHPQPVRNEQHPPQGDDGQKREGFINRFSRTFLSRGADGGQTWGRGRKPLPHFDPNEQMKKNEKKKKSESEGPWMVVLTKPDEAQDMAEKRGNGTGFDVPDRVIRIRGKEASRYEIRYFSLVTELWNEAVTLTEQLNPPSLIKSAAPSESQKRQEIARAVDWFVIADDDTFFPDIDLLYRVLGERDPSEPWLIGGMSESRRQVAVWGMMAYGGAGIIASRGLMERMNREGVFEECLKLYGRNFGGDSMVTECAASALGRSSKQVTTFEPSLHQFDINGDGSGIFEAGWLISSVHHWASWMHIFPLWVTSRPPSTNDKTIRGVSHVLRVGRAAKALGGGNWGRRFVFDWGWDDPFLDIVADDSGTDAKKHVVAEWILDQKMAEARRAGKTTIDLGEDQTMIEEGRRMRRGKVVVCLGFSITIYDGHGIGEEELARVEHTWRDHNSFYPMRSAHSQNLEKRSYYLDSVRTIPVPSSSSDPEKPEYVVVLTHANRENEKIDIVWDGRGFTDNIPEEPISSEPSWSGKVLQGLQGVKEWWEEGS